MTTIIKTADLTGPALNWAVAKCEGHVKDFDEGAEVSGLSMQQWHWQPSTDWKKGGPIIEREGIELSLMHDDDSTAANRKWSQWAAGRSVNDMDLWSHEEFGPTPLVAAMRCYVASKLGDTVEVPEELVK